MRVLLALTLGLLFALPLCAGSRLQESPPKAQAAAPKPQQETVRKLAGDMGFVEGPVWIAEQSMLVFSDIPRSKLMRWSEKDGLSLFRESNHPNGNLLDLDGRLLTCQHGARNIVRWNAEGEPVVLADHYGDKRLNSPNDLALASDGTLWFTDPPWGLPKQTDGKELDGHFVFRLAPPAKPGARGEVTLVLRTHAMPNGIALSIDEKTLYVADTGGHRSHPDPTVRKRPATLTAYAIQDDKSLAPEPRWVVETLCDGMCLDERGNVYATGEKGVTIWSPTGASLGLIPVPEKPANVCFGGASNKTLFITARTSLYAIDLDVAGRPLPKRQ